MLRNKRNWFDKIRTAQTLKHLAFFGLGCLSWLGFSYLFTLYIKILQGGSLTDFPWHYDAPLWNFRFCLLGALIIIFVKWKFNLFSDRSKHIFLDFLILLLMIPLNAFLLTAISNSLGLTYTGGKATSYDWVMGLLHSTISQGFVGFSCFAYFYLALVNKTKERLLAAQRASNEMQIKMLQQNIEPHFLFNNLNVLSSLIQSNPLRASQFLEKLAELYRYILQSQNVEILPIQQELEFARNYLFLLKERFGNAYDVTWEVPPEKINGQMIVPSALQNLIENIFKHNAGDPQEPLQILVKLDENSVVVKNELRPKSNLILSSGTGLENLRTRYSLLTERTVEIFQDEKSFSVKLPLLELKK